MERENKRAGEKLEARDRESYALPRQMSGLVCTLRPRLSGEVM